KLRQLLAACSVEGDLVRPIRWSEALILQNYGAIPPAVGKHGFYVWNRGFNLLLLGRRGEPRYFCKCRPAADQNLGRETAVLRALNRDPELSGVAPLPRLLQHGDLWPANILWHQGSWRLLDFESFGRVQVPLYDVHHFVRTCGSLRRPRSEATGGWLDRLASRDREAALCRETIRREAGELGLNAAQALGVLLYYLVDITAQFRLRGVPRSFWGPLALEVQRAADTL